ncbi:glycoside hydrolase family 57 protein [Luteolibacter pohnpeiensis]|uniref:Glycoside hydrolase family 57 protein n=1 Tax=Luteolibacter pohnpeiensis TaxID=454153 RepID=A0A934VV33_9BACT|nr:glycoside hydrolase family 57 protein [Luteolibacter pohnpeiensis]MBK1881378.1 glycoside hydrolase family 57 protein [Luteolibacter pohnpeiensis]
MPDVCLYLQVHQPNRLIPYDFFRIGEHAFYEDDGMNAGILNKVAEKCYLPANRMFKQLLEEHQGRFRMALSISGMVIEQMERYRPDVLESFQELIATGSVEILAETYYHSLAFVHSNREFERQVQLHLDKVEDVFSVRPRVFRNTELIYNNAIAAKAETMGFDGVIAEAVERTMMGQSPNFLYRAPDTARVKTLLRNIGLSDDLGFRFSDKNWCEYPLTPEKFASWIVNSPGDVVNLFMDYESIGEHQWKDSGVFEFWQALPEAIIEAGSQWVTPSEAVDLYRASRVYDCQFITSWADEERDLSAWMGNVMQQEAIAKVHRLEEAVLAVKDPDLTHTWAKMQTSDHFYWMSTKGGTDGSVHSYFTPYPSPYDAYIYFMNVLADLQIHLRRAQEKEDAAAASAGLDDQRTSESKKG